MPSRNVELALDDSLEIGSLPHDANLMECVIIGSGIAWMYSVGDPDDVIDDEFPPGQRGANLTRKRTRSRDLSRDRAYAFQ